MSRITRPLVLFAMGTVALTSLTGCATSYPAYPECAPEAVAPNWGLEPSSVTQIGDFEKPELLQGSAVECAGSYEFAVDSIEGWDNPDVRTANISVALISADSMAETLDQATTDAGYEPSNGGWSQGEAFVNVFPAIVQPVARYHTQYVMVWISDKSLWD